MSPQPDVPEPLAQPPWRECAATLLWLAALMVVPYTLALILAAVTLGVIAGMNGLQGEVLAETVKAQIIPPALGFWIASLFAGVLMILCAQALAARRFGAVWHQAIGLVPVPWTGRLAGQMAMIFLGYFGWAALVIASLNALWPAQVVMPEITSAAPGAGAAAPIAFLFIAIITPIAEELIFRGYTFARLRSVFSPALAIGLSAGLFAMAHFNGGILHPLITLYLGLAAGWLRHARASLLPGMVLHGLVNSLAVAAMLAR